MHKAKACIIKCIDFRFNKEINAYLAENGYMGHSDIISIAGGSRDFIKPVHEDDGVYAWKQLGLSIKLHEPDEILIIDHEECGGYAQDGTIPVDMSSEDDKACHEVFLNQLTEKILQKYPNKKVIPFFISKEGKVYAIELA